MTIHLRTVVTGCFVAAVVGLAPATRAQAHDDPQVETGPDFQLSETRQTGQRQRGPEPEHGTTDYRGVSAFFNVREAYSNVRQGEWELEFSFEWETESEGDDDFEMAQSVKYGFTDDFHIELEIEQPGIGDGGGSGAGESSLTLFYNCTKEQDRMPAVGSYIKGRFPTGDGSAGVDVTFGTAITKSITDDLRLHLGGFLTSANGHIGEEDQDGQRRPFQWGAGLGFDYRVSGQTLVGLNYLNRVNHERGHPNQNLLELELVQDIGRFGGAEHEIKVAADFGLDGHESTPNAAIRIQWAIEW